MNAADLRPGDTIIARHVQARGERPPVLTETTLVVEKVYAKDRFVTGRPSKRFVYVKGCPEAGQTVPAGPDQEAVEFDHVVSVVVNQVPAAIDQVPQIARLQLLLTVDYVLGEHSVERARDALSHMAQRAAGAGLLTEGLPGAEVACYAWQVDSGPEEQHPVPPPCADRPSRVDRPRH